MPKMINKKFKNKENIRKGTLKVSIVDSEGFEVEIDDEEVYCEICNRPIHLFNNDYIWLMRTNDVEEHDKSDRHFCSRKCWNEWVLREAEEIRLC